MSSRIYLDYCATTPVHSSVREKISRALDADFGNPSSMHWAGKDSKQLMTQARADVAEGIGCIPDEIIFTSGATEADNLALFGTLRLYPAEKAHFITSAIEHHAILHTAAHLEREGYSVTYLPVDENGLVNSEDVRHAIRPETKLISIMYVNNEVGSIQPIAEIGRIAREYNVWFHTDAVQAIGLFDVNVDDLNVDLLSLSAHKIYGPKGIGALYIRSGLELTPMVVGGPQERSLRAGTENVPGIVGLGAAMNLVSQHRADERARLLGLRKYLVNGLQTIGPAVIVNGLDDKIASHILSISFVGALAIPVRTLVGNALPQRFRSRVRAFLEGIVVYSGMSLAGAVLLAAGALPADSLAWAGGALALLYLAANLGVRRQYVAAIVSEL